MRWGSVSSPKQKLIGQKETASGCARGRLDWILGKIPSLKELSSNGAGKWLSHHPWGFKSCVDVALGGMV